MTRIGVLGADGRMGRAIVRAIAANPGARLVAAVERAGSPTLGQDAGLVAGVGPKNVLIQEGLPHKGVAQVWGDFSVPARSLVPDRGRDRHPDHPGRRRHRRPHGLFPGQWRAHRDHPPRHLARHLRPRRRPRRPVGRGPPARPLRLPRRPRPVIGRFGALPLRFGAMPRTRPAAVTAAATDFGTLPTEALNPRARHLDTMAPEEIARLMLSEELKAVRAAGTPAHQIGKAARLVARRLAAGGRLVYAGAGTSGGLGTLAARAGVPAFGAPPPRAG